MDQAIELNPNELKTYYSRAEININLRDGKSALEDINKVLQMDPRSITGYKLRATIYRDLLHQSDLARQDLNMLKKLDPE